MSIQLLPKPLPQPVAKEIKDWLDMPAAWRFQEYVAAKAAEAVAHVGNCSISLEDSDKDDIAVHAAIARAFTDTNKVIDEVRNSVDKLQIAEMKPRTIVTQNVNPTQ